MFILLLVRSVNHLKRQYLVFDDSDSLDTLDSLLSEGDTTVGDKEEDIPT